MYWPKGVYHLLIYTKMCVLDSSFQIRRMPPWQTLHNSTIQDGVQDSKKTQKKQQQQNKKNNKKKNKTKQQQTNKQKTLNNTLFL